ncbi:MAG: hypothetical protein GY854_24540 [Deltaproteobacteria bacterium]|nr:hypothetical protein [Deltaproteobacteria bacterium]
MTSLMDPVNAPPAAEAVTDENGLIELKVGQEATDEPVGLVAHTNVDNYYYTLTEIVEREIGGMIYPSGIRNHDIWAVPSCVFLIFNATLAEKFDAYRDDVVVSNYEATVGGGGGGTAYVTTIQIDQDSQ